MPLRYVRDAMLFILVIKVCSHTIGKPYTYHLSCLIDLSISWSMLQNIRNCILSPTPYSHVYSQLYNIAPKETQEFWWEEIKK